MNDELLIRWAAKHSHLNQIDAIDEAIIGEAEDRATLSLQAEQQRLLLAVRDERVVGYLAWGWLWDHLPMLQLLRVAPDCHRQGVARALIEACERYLQDRGHDSLISSADRNNHASHRLHLACGFAVCGYVNFEPSSEVFYRKSLA